MRWRDDSGVATAFTAIAVLAVLAVTAIVLQLGAATVARHRVETAADMGALAGALVVLDGHNAACSQAGSIVAANGATMATCTLDGADVLVTASLTVRVGPMIATATAHARAGPTAAQSP